MVESWLKIMAALALSYLLGALPTGYLAGRLKGLDIRKLGSGNMGATNVMRILGVPAGVLVMLIDAAKGFLAVAWLPGLTPYPEFDWLRVGCGLAAVLGHTFTLFLKFKGGKGVATTAGIFLALAPMAAVVTLLIFACTVAMTKTVSAGSILGALLLPPLVWILGEAGQGYSILLIAVVLAILIVARHGANIQRLKNGTENKIGRPVEPKDQQGGPS